MSLALIKNGQISVYPYSMSEFRAANPNVSLPENPTEAQLNEQGMYTVYPTPQPKYNPILQNETEGAPENTDNKWYQTWVITEATQQEIEYRSANAKTANANYGKQLLLDTDWAAPSSIADPAESNPHLVNRQEFLAYRSAVRAIVLNPSVEAPNWPAKPNEVWSS